MKSDDRLYMEIDTSIIKHKISQIKNSCKVKIMYVAKANCYGTSHKLLKKLEENIDYIGVATIEEAIEIRRSLGKIPILVLGYIPKSKLSLAIKHNIEVSLYSYKTYEEMLSYLTKNDAKLNIHLAIDTGMHRMGFESEKVMDICIKVKSSEVFILKGIYSHLASVNTNKNYTKTQFSLFQKIYEKTKDDKIIFHLLNSDASLKYSEKCYDMVRVGIEMYRFSEQDREYPIKIFARIVCVKARKKGDFIGYDNTFVCEKDCCIATVSFGYADGLDCRASNRYSFYYKNRSFLVVGKVCMDYCFVLDEENILREGEVIEVFGNENISEKKLETIFSTSIYEILCKNNRRTKVYIK